MRLGEVEKLAHASRGDVFQALARVKGVPVFMSHGTRDPLLPFATSRALRDTLASAGADLDWVEFPGGHEIPRPVLAGVARLITRVAAGT